MPGRSLRLFAATAALMFLSISGAAAGWYGGGCCAAPPAPVNWGCGNSCAPMPSYYYGHHHYGHRHWGCGSSCGGLLPMLFSGGCGNGCGYRAAPIHVVSQGPVYEPPLTGYTYPAYRYEQERDYPYMPGYGTYYGGGHYGHRHFRRGAHWGGYGVPHRHYRYPLSVRGQVVR